MSRVLELALLVAPLAAFLLWRVMIARGVPNPSGRAIALCVVLVAALGVGLVWTGLHERHRGGGRYVPAEERDGRIIPGHDT